MAVFKDPVGSLTNFVDSIIKGLSSIGPQIVPILEGLGKAMLDSFKLIGEEAWKGFTEAITGVGQWFTDNVLTAHQDRT